MEPFSGPGCEGTGAGGETTSPPELSTVADAGGESLCCIPEMSVVIPGSFAVAEAANFECEGEVCRETPARWLWCVGVRCGDEATDPCTGLQEKQRVERMNSTEHRCTSRGDVNVRV